ERNIETRLGPTLTHARAELARAQAKAKMSGYALNACIGAQVILGALTTGVAAATTGKHTSIATSILGGLSTLAASYLARARGSGQPERSIVRAHDLQHFIRDCEAFLLDWGYHTGTDFEHEVRRYRMRLEEILSDGTNVDGTSVGPRGMVGAAP
ncbi:uncharacterized protein LAESUDRAFT_603536, partial [Laetiporus sulphureus 93-53]